MGTVHLWCISYPGATWLLQTFWLGMFSRTLKAAAVLSLWPKIPNRNSDNSETEGEEGSDNGNFEEQHADWPLGNTSQTVSVQSSVGDRMKSNSCNKEQPDKGEAREKQKEKDEICETVSDVSKAGEDIPNQKYRHKQLWLSKDLLTAEDSGRPMVGGSG